MLWTYNVKWSIRRRHFCFHRHLHHRRRCLNKRPMSSTMQIEIEMEKTLRAQGSFLYLKLYLWQENNWTNGKLYILNQSERKTRVSPQISQLWNEYTNFTTLHNILCGYTYMLLTTNYPLTLFTCVTFKSSNLLELSTISTSLFLFPFTSPTYKYTSTFIYIYIESCTVF